MNCKQFNSVQLEEVLLSLGHLPKKQNEKEAWFLNPFGTETEASFKLDKRQNIWYLHSEGVGGNNIDFLKKYFNYSINEILSWASEKSFSSIHQQAVIDKPNYNITEVAEIQNWNLKKYLFERGLTQRSFRFLKEIKFTINNKKLYAVGFENLSGGWELRNSFYKGSLLKKDISIIKNDSNKIVVFEGFFDALSYIEFQEKLKEDIITLNSVSMLNRAKNYLQNYSEILLFLDNDPAGKKTKDELLSSFSNAVDYSFIYKDYKDFNEFLVADKGGFIQQDETGQSHCFLLPLRGNS
ncbi:toprim domain-containing protein [Chryseobacterium sp. SL1]|uniref:toprim domain-containing protein n=1 Tax=Chryseobacterium sp. SL1 TaxID=2995159 RepID=UPI0022738B15|nr:toprim domain-containing protein [Chryseobacterium sp. SL1]MCY1662771.1 toprim domain-containing protein [Chryseobacterium sp. SL1]